MVRCRWCWSMLVGNGSMLITSEGAFWPHGHLMAYNLLQIN
jgi:hypothetical protein